MLFLAVDQYARCIESILPWCDKIHSMATTFQQFSVACTKHYPSSMFAIDAELGTIGIDVKIVAAFFHHLRFKGGDIDSASARKVSTIHNMWQQTKSGLVNDLSPSFNKPDWLLCSPNKFAILKRVLAKWKHEDLQNMPIKTYLLEEHVEEFCMEAIWYHMQAGTPILEYWLGL